VSEGVEPLGARLEVEPFVAKGGLQVRATRGKVESVPLNQSSAPGRRRGGKRRKRVEAIDGPRAREWLDGLRHPIGPRARLLFPRLDAQNEPLPGTTSEDGPQMLLGYEGREPWRANRHHGGGRLRPADDRHDRNGRRTHGKSGERR
jgi:hypothetical protein